MIHQPIALRLKTRFADRRINTATNDFTFRKTAPGGFASATISLFRPIKFQPQEIGGFGKLYAYDTRNGNTIWEGRVEDIGKNSDDSGQIWELSAIGPGGYAQDRMRALFYVDTRMEAILPGQGSYKATENTTDETANGDSAIRQFFPKGVTVATNDKTISYYQEMRAAGLKLARIDGSVWAGFTSATDWRIRWWVSTPAPTFVNVRSSSPVLGDMGTTSRVVGTDWTNGEDLCSFEFQYIAAGGTIGNDNTWILHYELAVQMVRKDLSGNDIVTSSEYNTASGILPHKVIIDLLGRMLPYYDDLAANIDTTSNYLITQLAYPDGTTANQVLDDVMNMIGTHLWEVLETNSETGLYRFNWRTWPTAPRYDVGLNDGYQSPESVSDLYNEVLVRWKDKVGRIRTTLRTSSVQALTDANLVRTGYIDLSDNVGSLANAQQQGDAFLVNHAQIGNSGTLTIARPIIDRLTGRTVMPWEIQAGYLVRIKGIQPQLDFLNSSRNGVTVCRIVSVEYNTGSGVATLELDDYSVDQQRQIAKLQSDLKNRRRR